MPVLLIWFIAYVIPALSADAFVKFLPKQQGRFYSRNAAIVHGALLFSALLSQYAVYRLGYTFPWQLNAVSISLYLAVLISTYFIIGKLGLWYSLSSLLQESSLLSIAFLLFSTYPFIIVVALIVPIFSFSHLLHAEHWFMRIAIISLWGITSLILFSWLHNIWIIAALHALLGAYFIKEEILYPPVHFRKKKWSGIVDIAYKK